MIRPEYYKLVDKVAVPCEINETEWSPESKRVGYDAFGEGDSKVEVSTVFLTLDHNFYDGPPLLFETMVFGGPHDEFQVRCSTWEQAEIQHKSVCRMVTEDWE